MRSEFDMKISTKDMYNFLMYHTYHALSGIVSIIAGIGLIVYYILEHDGDGRNTWVFLFFGILFLVYQPWTLYIQAAKKTKLNPVFKQPLHYIAGETEITVAQEASSDSVDWEHVWKVREDAKSIFVYTSDRNAFIWVKAQLGSEEETVRALIRKMVKPRRVRLKK